MKNKLRSEITRRLRITLFSIFIIVVVIGFFTVLNSVIKGDIITSGKIQCNSGEINLNIEEYIKSEDEIKSECMKECKDEFNIEQWDTPYQDCFDDCLVYTDKKEYKYNLKGFKNIQCNIEGNTHFPAYLLNMVSDI